MSDRHGTFDGNYPTMRRAPDQAPLDSRHSRAEARPGGVTVAAWMTIVMSGLTLMLMGMAAVGFFLAYLDPAVFRDTAVPVDDREMVLAMAVYATVCAVLSVIAIPLGALVLAGFKVARASLSVVAVLSALASIPATVGVLGVIPLVLIIGSLVMLHRRTANQWFASVAQQRPRP